MGLRQFTINSATTSGNINMNPGNLSVNLACSSNRQFSAAGPTIELPKRPNTPWVNFFKATLPEYRKKHPGAKVSDLMSKISEEWKKLPAQKKVRISNPIKSGSRLRQGFLCTSSFQDPMVAQYEAEKVKFQKLMDKVPEEVKPNNICSVDKVKSCFSLAGEGKGKGREASEESIYLRAERSCRIKGLITI